MLVSEVTRSITMEALMGCPHDDLAPQKKVFIHYEQYLLNWRLKKVQSHMALIYVMKSSVTNNPSHDPPHDLIGAFQDLVDSRIPHVLLYRVVFEVAVPSMQLQGTDANGKAGVSSKEFGHGTHHHGRGPVFLQCPGCLLHH